MTECLIAGCALFCDGEPGVGLWGDLRRVGNTLVFVGVWDAARRTATWEDSKNFENCPHVTVEDAMERRGIFVFERSAASFNQAAQLRMALWPEGEDE